MYVNIKTSHYNWGVLYDTSPLMGLRAISFRPNLQEMRAIRRSCSELGVNRSELMRAALSQWLHVLRDEGVVSSSPPVRH